MDSREQVEEAAQKLRSQGVEEVLVKLGSEGSLLVGPEGTLYQPIVKADEVLSNALLALRLSVLSQRRQKGHADICRW